MPRKSTPVEDRLLAKVVERGACWVYTGALTTEGYGQISQGRARTLLTHRVVYRLVVGVVPAGLELDHLCRNRACCNPAHLEPVKRRVNILRGIGVGAVNARKTTCPQGHALSGSNLYVSPRGKRSCRSCKRAQWRAYNARRAAA